MNILVCPGFNPVDLNYQFINSFSSLEVNWLLFPSSEHPPYFVPAILGYWEKSVSLGKERDSLILIGFSAGVVGAWGTAIILNSRGLKIKALIAIDGWGVPLWGNFPIYRLSHDYFTHWSSHLLGGGKKSFYADPPVEHLQLWRSPQTTKGWKINTDSTKIAVTASEFIKEIILIVK
jgi:hypothetical protein